MCEQTEIDYLDGDIVWVKLGSCWWPGEVVGTERLPPDVLPSFRKPPIAIVKFFQESTYEYVKNINSIYKYNCSRKNEFIIKGLDMYRTKPHMEKFPEDVIRAETAVGGDKEILTRDEFQERKKESYAGIFGDKPKKIPGSGKRGRPGGRGRPTSESPKISTPIRKFYKEKSDYHVHILLQGPKETHRQSTETASTPSTSRAGSEPAEDKPQKVTEDKPTTFSTPTVSSSGIYSCHSCSFSTSRLNVLVLHNKTHSATFIPYTPSPVRKKPATKSPTKSTPKTSKTPKTPRPRKEKTEKPKKSAKKRPAEDKPANAEVKKPKTDEEIKSSLLADWDDDVDEDSNDESSAIIMSGSPEFPVGAESPAVPTPAEIPSAQIPVESSSPEKKIDEASSSDKPEASSDSKYEFCEDEEWHVEADAGRKIPRVKNPSKRKEETKSVSIDEEDVAKEVAELLTKTAVPELPSIPEPLKAEENFPEPPVVKSPDKKSDHSEKKTPEKTIDSKPTKAIFKTKTFFRSRHSRSQDAIGKYVAEQLNAAERMDMSESDINGSEPVSSPEARESPPIEHIKVARLAPKIQLKKMKAEAAQLREKEISGFDQFGDDSMSLKTTASKLESSTSGRVCLDNKEEDNTEKVIVSQSLQDVLYPTQEIKPINKDSSDKLLHKDDKLLRKEDKLHHKEHTKTTFNEYKFDNVDETDRGLTMESDVKQEIDPKTDKQISAEISPETSPNTPKLQSPKQESSEKDLQVSYDSREIHSPMENNNEQIRQEEPEQTIEIPLPAGMHERVEQHETVQDLPEKVYETSPHKSHFELLETTPHKSQIETVLENSTQKSTYVKTPEKSPQKSNFEVLEKSPQKSNFEVLEKSPQKSNFEILEKSPQKSNFEVLEKSPQKSKYEVLEKSPQKSNFVEKSPLKTRDQQCEISSSIESPKSSPKKIEQSFKIYSPKKLNDASPQKLHDQSKEISLSTVKFPEPVLQKSYEQLTARIIEPYMSESTASAVDALLSVSRETDRVPRIVGDDPPEDLFEDDNRDSSTYSEVDNVNVEISQGNGICEDHKMEPEKVQLEEKIDDINVNVQINQDVTNDEVNQNILLEDMPKTNDTEVIEDTISSDNIITETVIENTPSESDLQIAETLLNLPSTAIQNKTPDEPQENIPICIESEQIEEEIIPASETIIEENAEIIEEKRNVEVSNAPEVPPESLTISDSDNLNVRYETEQEKSENYNAAQSLVQMSESVDHKINILESKEIKKKDVLNIDAFKTKRNNGIDSNNTVEQKIALLSNENNNDSANAKSPKFETTSSKLMKILEEPTKTPVKKVTPLKHVIVSGKEKILNFDVAKSPLKAKPQTPKQKIIIRRAASNKTIINNLNDVMSSPDKIILSRNKPAQDGSIQTFTIQASPEIHTTTDPKQIIIQPKMRKISKPTKLQKIKPHNSLITPLNEPKTLNETTTVEEPMFDINSMPVVLSEDILTPESIEKMPIVMSDGNMIANTTTAAPNPPKLVKTKPTIIENEKVAISALPVPNKPEVKTLLMNTTSEVTKVTTPNILSKSSKLRGAKPMLVIDKTTGKQKIIMTKAEPTIKEIKPAPTLIQSVPQTTTKTEKFIILPTASTTRPGRAQKIVIDPQTGKAHVLVAKGQEKPLSVPENKPVSAKLIPSSSDASTPGNTVMIITNAQGAQSRIVLTPEHEKILFPNKQQPNVSQLKTITHRISTTTGVAQKTIVTSATPMKTQTKIVPKQKSAIITSKGQLIVGGRVATPAQNIAPMPEIRPAPKRIVASEPKQLVQAIQKNASEPLIFLQQKSGTVMQLTAAQFEHLQRTGQIIHKAPAPVQENKVVVQKSITITPKETVVSTVQKQRMRKTATESSTPAKKLKQEIPIAPAPPLLSTSPPMPPLTSLSSSTPAPLVSISSIVPSVSNTVSISTTPSYPDLENFEELLPSTAIARQIQPPPVPPPPEPQPVMPQPEPIIEPPPAQLSDGQLLAVPGESFGGPPGTFYLCVEDNGNFTPIDNRPLILENNQLVPVAVEPVVFCPQPERRDILEAALANSDVFHADTARDEAPAFRDLNANVSVHCRVSETSSTLNQPIMTPVEMPSKGESEPAVPSNLEAGLAVIGVTPNTVPTSLELPITVTDPRIAPKTTSPLSNSNFGTTLLASPNTETFVSAEVAMGGISMPILTDEETSGGGGKSMPILTDDVAERAASSAGSTGSPSSLEVRESEPEEGPWSRRLLTPGSDTSEASAEIPLQPAIQLSVAELTRHS